MTDEIKIVNLNSVIGSLVASGDTAEVAGAYALGQVALAIERQAKINAAQGGTHKRGEKTGAIPGRGPARVTGALQRSITTDLRKGFGSYVAQVGPGMFYARWVEQGSSRWKGGVNYPYLYPAAETVSVRANTIFTEAFKRRFRRG
jgi:hypothetical protein